MTTMEILIGLAIVLVIVAIFFFTRKKKKNITKWDFSGGGNIGSNSSPSEVLEVKKRT